MSWSHLLKKWALLSSAGSLGFFIVLVDVFFDLLVAASYAAIHKFYRTFFKFIIFTISYIFKKISSIVRQILQVGLHALILFLDLPSHTCYNGCHFCIFVLSLSDHLLDLTDINILFFFICKVALETEPF